MAGRLCGAYRALRWPARCRGCVAGRCAAGTGRDRRLLLAMFLVDRRPGTREGARCQKRGRKRMAELAAVYDCAPAPREPAGIIAPPGADNKKRSPGPKPRSTGPFG